MKGIDMFCASQASTAICLSMDQPSSSSSAGLGGRAIDRHNPIIRDGRRFTTAPCLSQTPPINPLPYHQLHKSKKNKKKSKPNDTNINSSDDGIYKNVNHSSSSLSVDIKRKSIVTPPGSSRYLLGESTRFDGLSDLNNDPVLGLVPAQSIDKPSSPPHKPSPPSNQVVVLRVSLHCKGCAGKLRKHLSRMEGVTSFNIDFAAKKVTIVGDVTPLSVLASVSKVKNAQFWPAPQQPTTPLPAYNLEINKLIN